jgi:hypothetical protein
METNLMCPTLALNRCEVRVGQVIAFPASSSESSSKKQLAGVVGELFQSISSILEDLVLRVLDKHTAAEFEAVRAEVFPKYFEAMHALSSLAVIAVPVHVLDRLSAEFFCEMEAACRDHALVAFGADVRDQLLFTVWTLRKTADLCRTIAAAPLASDIKDQDSSFAFEYARAAVWTRFHMDCLLKSMEMKRPIYPEVHDLVIDGLRAAVNAYAWARRGLDLRSPTSEAATALAEWDGEDQQLLNEATFDEVAEA